MTFRRIAFLAILLVVGPVALSACAGASAAPLALPADAASSGLPALAPDAATTPCAAATQAGATASTTPVSACNLHGPVRAPAAGALAGLPTAASPATSGAPVQVAVEGAGSYTSVEPAALADMLKTKDFRLVNVHTPYVGEIAGTDLWLPYDQIERRLGELPADKTARILVYCRSGAMSAIAARVLVKLGYTNVWNLDGGMSAWEQAGYSLVKPQ